MGDKAASSSATQLVFFATHAIDEIDGRLLRHAARDLRAHRSAAELWVLMFSNVSAGGVRLKSFSGIKACVWGIDAMQQALPRFASAIFRSPGA